MIKLVSVDSLRKTGIFADEAGDFWRFPPQTRQAGVQRQKRIREKPGFPACSRAVGSLAKRRTAWLGREGSNLRMAESKSAALPLGYAPTGSWLEPKRPMPLGRYAYSRYGWILQITTKKNPCRIHAASRFRAGHPDLAELARLRLVPRHRPPGSRFAKPRKRD